MRKLLYDNPREFLLKFGVKRTAVNNYTSNSNSIKVPWHLKWKILYSLAPKKVRELMDDINERMSFDKDI